jgi:transcriptional regulator with XRE-family HTH domain
LLSSKLVLYVDYNRGGKRSMATFGEFFRTMRAKRELSLREFCLDNKLDPGNLSKLERGLMPPPESREKLEQYASALKIKKGSDDWYTFFDLAAAERGRIPDDMLSDETVVEQLPVLFRTLRGQRVDPKLLDELVEKIRKA